MAGEKPEEEVEMTQEQQEQEFNAGFEDGAPPATQQQVNAEGQPEATTETPVVEEEVEYVQVSKKDFERMMAAATTAETVEAQFNKVFGTIGNVKNELLQKLQAGAPAGASVELTDEDFAELKADFPELAGHTRLALERILKRVGVKGTGEATLDTEKLTAQATERVRALQLEELDDMHPGWRDTVGKPADVENPFRKWLATQPKEYQDKISNTESASVTKRAIDKFEAAQKVAAAKPAPAKPAQPSPQTAIRKDRIEAAVTPRGSGVAPVKKPLTEEDHFQAGFQSG